MDAVISPLSVRSALRATRAAADKGPLSMSSVAGRRRAPVAAHVYTLPVVRELPSQPTSAAADLTW